MLFLSSGVVFMLTHSLVLCGYGKTVCGALIMQSVPMEMEMDR